MEGRLVFKGVLYVAGVGQLQGVKSFAFTSTTQIDTFCSTIAKPFGVQDPAQLICYRPVSALWGSDLKDPQATLPNQEDCVGLAVQDVWQGVTNFMRDRQPEHLPFEGDVICVDAAASAVARQPSPAQPSQGDAVRVRGKRRREADASSSDQVQYVNLHFTATHPSCLDSR